MFKLLVKAFGYGDGHGVALAVVDFDTVRAANIAYDLMRDEERLVVYKLYE